jgi:hypothetical protein
MPIMLPKEGKNKTLGSILTILLSNIEHRYLLSTSIIRSAFGLKISQNLNKNLTRELNDFE